MIVPMYVYINDSKGEIKDEMPEDDAVVGTTLDAIEHQSKRDDLERETIN